MCGILALVIGQAIRFDERPAAAAAAVAAALEDANDDTKGEAPSSSSSSSASSSVGRSEEVVLEDVLAQAGWWLESRGPDGQATVRETIEGGEGRGCRMLMAASLLQTRGERKLQGPAMKDAQGNSLAFNGEIYAGLGGLNEHENDSLVLLRELARPEAKVDDILSKLRGPWSIVYWQARTRTLWFGRDVIGRRSLLQFSSSTTNNNNKLTRHHPFFAISSVSLPGCKDTSEIPPGIYSLSLGAGGNNLVCRHSWRDEAPMLLSARSTCCSSSRKASSTREGKGEEEEEEEELLVEEQAAELLKALRKSVRIRCSLVSHHHDQGGVSDFKDISPASVAIMYSGGLDSAILATLAAEATSSSSAAALGSLDLINICFADGKSPDRIAALEGIKELQHLHPEREWRIIEVNSSLDDVDAMREELLQLLNPADTYMDLNIGAALSIAARGTGVLKRYHQGSFEEVCQSYTSAARVILCGHGADEQCGGYGRHRTKFREGGWDALAKEIELDVNRLWHRNLGRDDRCISNQGRESRFPFLDEDVAIALRKMPIQIKVDPTKPPGVGDKQVLRVIAKRFLDLNLAAQRTKRAIQFGSRIAKLSNVRDFGSNRAANKTSAGSVILPEKMES